ncbi:MAG: glucose 1-dehydrogenase [Dehalococcoidales bacterium]|nr:glucose 1-dehydrogenase [Dehalococcoidales bacterium]
MAEAKTGQRLKDKVAIITGGAYGIGKIFARRMAAEGAAVVIADIDINNAEKTVEELKVHNARILAVHTDVSDEKSTLSMAKKTTETFGSIDILINNAAIFSKIKVSVVPFDKLDMTDWDRMMAVNLRGTFLCSRAVFPYMKKQNKGKIINMASATFFEGTPVMPHYVASKAGIIGLTRSLASAMAEYNINVNCIAPGRTLSEDLSDESAVKNNEIRAKTRQLKRIEYPEDLVGTAVFLASEDSDFITGQTIVVDGGTIFH